MTTSINHPQGVTLDLLTDLIARLDCMLCRVETTRVDFQESVRADPAKALWPPLCDAPHQVISMNPDLRTALAKVNPTNPKSIDQLMLELHSLHAKLGTLLVELERHSMAIASDSADARH